jgi:hypothetical protein
VPAVLAAWPLALPAWLGAQLLFDSGAVGASPADDFGAAPAVPLAFAGTAARAGRSQAPDADTPQTAGGRGAVLDALEQPAMACPAQSGASPPGLAAGRPRAGATAVSAAPGGGSPLAVPAAARTAAHGAALPGLAAGAHPRTPAPDPLGILPLAFEANAGQADSPFDFLARGPDYSVGLAPTEATIRLVRPAAHRPAPASPSADAVVRMRLVGADPSARAAGVSPLGARANYFLGKDPARWHTEIPTYARVVYPKIYPGIDLAYHSSGDQLEYDFAVRPGADARLIRLDFPGADAVEVDPAGDLLVHAGGQTLVQHAPVAYQDAGVVRQPVASRFVVHAELKTPNAKLITFEVGAYDHSRPLVIDPLVLGYSTYVSGPVYGSTGEHVTVAADGSIYVAGLGGPDFPVTPGAYDTRYNGQGDVFVAKLKPDGNGQKDLVWSTFLGGSGADDVRGLAVDGQGNAYLSGTTQSIDFPTTLGAFQPKYGGGFFDAFVAELSADGNRLKYGTYLGGSDDDRAEGLAIDAVGSAYVTGRTYSADFPTTPGAFQTAPQGNQDAFVAKLSPDGSKLDYGTYLGGSQDDRANAIAVDGVGAAYVTGSLNSADFPITPGAFDTTYNGGTDAFVAKLTPNGSALAYGTYLGGSQGFPNYADAGSAIGVDGRGNAYVTGTTDSTNFPTTPGAFQTQYAGGLFDGFVTKLAPAGDKLVYSTYLGGATSDEPEGVAIDRNGAAFVVGGTDSGNFPTTPGALQKAFGGGQGDGFVTQLKRDGSGLLYSSYLGGASTDSIFGMATGPDGSVYVTGRTKSYNFPTTPGAFQRSKLNGSEYAAFVTELKSVAGGHGAPGLRPIGASVGPVGSICCGGPP